MNVDKKRVHDQQLSPIGIIGGSGFAQLNSYLPKGERKVPTPYGDPSSPLYFGLISGIEVVFIPRHGVAHTIPPHRVNYRANISALHEVGVRKIIAIAAVGGIQKTYAPGTLTVPDQVLDYTHGRDHTFFDETRPVGHVEFSYPYCEEMRRRIINCAGSLGIRVNQEATYAATQGPRFESAAEIDRLEKDGANVVGMTGMPEASLAREKSICYATLAMVVNYAAGRSDGLITQSDIEAAFDRGSALVYKILGAVVPALDGLEFEVPEIFSP